MRKMTHRTFSMPLKHGPIEVRVFVREVSAVPSVFHAPKAWPH